MWDHISDLHACHREVSVRYNCSKLTKETGEAAEACDSDGEWPGVRDRQ